MMGALSRNNSGSVYPGVFTSDKVGCPPPHLVPFSRDIEKNALHAQSEEMSIYVRTRFD